MSDVNVTLAMPEIVAKFREQLQNSTYQFKDNRVASVMDCLYVAYTDNQGRDPKEIDQCFIDLEYYLEKLSLEENNAIFKMVCRLCSLHEEKAFKDGLRLGAYLMLEIQES